MKRIIAGYGLSEAIAKGLNVLLMLSPAVFISLENVGVIAIIISIEQILIGVIGCDQQTVLLRYYSIFRGRLAQLYSASATIVFFATCGMLLLYAVYLFLPEWIPGVSKQDILLIIIASAFQGLFLLHLAYLRGGERVVEYGVFRILYAGLKLLSFITMMLIFRAAIAYPVSILIANGIVFLILALRNRRNFSGLRDIVRPVRSVIKQNMAMGLPLALQTTVGALYSVIDRFMLQYFFDQEQVGIYSFAFIQGTACIFFLQVLSLAFVPQIYRGETYTAETARTLSKFLRITVLSTFFTSLFIYFVVFPISLNFVNPVYREAYAGGRIVVALALISTVIDPIRLYGFYKLTFLRRVAIIPVIGIIAFVFRAVLGLIFIPAHGVAGAAIAIVLSVLLTGIIMVFTAGVMEKQMQTKQ